MYLARWLALLLCSLVCWSAAAPAALAQGKVGDLASEFPPGVFVGGNFKMSDFEGKALVLFFYEQNCPRCREAIPERNQVVAQFQGKPVMFIAVAAGDTLKEAQAYQRATNLAMPVFADALSLLESSYGTSISLSNIYQFRIIGPDGKIAGYSMEPDAIERVLANVKWKYKDEGYHEQLAAAIDLLEWNQWEAGMKLLKPALGSRNPAVKESVDKLIEQLLAEAEQWKIQAEAAISSNPARAFDLYTRISIVAANDDLGKEANEKLRELRRNKQVIDELAARKALDSLAMTMSTTPKSKAAAVAVMVQGIVEKYPDTPTAQYLKSLLERAASSAQAASL